MALRIVTLEFDQNKQDLEISNMQTFMKLADKVRNMSDIPKLLNDIDYISGNAVAGEISQTMRNSIMLLAARAITEMGSVVDNLELGELDGETEVQAAEYIRKAFEKKLRLLGSRARTLEI